MPKDQPESSGFVDARECSAGKPPGQLVIPICIALCLLVTWAYLPSLKNGFLAYDDDVYVTENARVQQGMTWENLRWAFANVDAAFWHPLTWLSHMLDVELYGLKAAGHHATNLLIHLANTLLVFLTLRRMTAAVWASAWVAALFGVHPLHVESVAWIAERKDLLSAFFFLMALWAYCRYVQSDAWRVARDKQGNAAGVLAVPPTTCHSSLFYGLTLLCFALGLMSKPMVVTLPLLLLLLDWWPLRRFELSTLNFQPSTILRLLWEKLPFFALAGVFTWVTLYAEKRYGAVSQAAGPAIGLRLANGLVSYVRYLDKTIWPVDLAVFYPYPNSIPLWQAVGAGAVLLGLTALVIVLYRKPFWAMGWFWYLVTLLPVIGVVQVGSHAMADRYTYIPLIGVFMLVTWGAGELTLHWRYRSAGLSIAAVVTVLLCLLLTRQQTSYWKDGETLFRHAVAVTQNNAMAYYNWGVALFNQGRYAEATSQFQEALRLRPGDADAHYNCGVALGRQGRLGSAIFQLEAALKLRPDHAEAHYNLGVALRAQGRLAEAITHFEEAVRLKPGYAEARTNLSIALDRKGASENK